jgi:steroid delta-isomerase-like uncharacterized protein
MSSEANAAVVRKLFEAFNEGDLDGAAALVTEDFELVDIAQGTTFEGPEGLRRWLGTFKSALPDGRTELVEVLVEGDRVATEHIGRGTHEGPLQTPAGAIPATGRSVELRFAETFAVREGKIARMRAFYDSATMMRQLGLLPETGSRQERAMTSVLAARIKLANAVRERLSS